MEEELPESVALTTRAQWKAIAHPLRLSILRLLVEASHTNEELARALETPSGQLHYHVRLLLGAELIRPVGTRPKGHLTEKLYRAVAKKWVATPPTLAGDAPPLLEVLHSGAALYQASWESEREVLLPQLGFHFVMEHSPEAVAEFSRRVRALYEQFPKPTAREGEGERIALTLLLHKVPKKSHH